MPTFGNYETVKELYRTGLITAYSARLLRSREEPECTVINYNLTFIVLNKNDSVKSEIDKLYNRIIAQKQIAAINQKYRRWAVVRDSGKTRTGAFYVTDKYPATLKMLIDDNASISAPAMYHIINSITQGLMELQDFYTTQNLIPKPHGNLRLENVLITNKYTPDNAGILLTEPCAYNETILDNEQYNDYGALGTIIYELATRQNLYGKIARWPVPESKEWLRLGKYAHAWRALCNDLLNHESDKLYSDLTELKDKLKTLKTGKRNRIYRKSLILASSVILAGAAAVASYKIYNVINNKPAVDVAFNDQNWIDLCRAYSEWFSNIHEVYVLNITPETKDILESDEDIKKTVYIISNVNIFDPYVIADDNSMSYNDLGYKPTDKARESDNIKNINAAVEAINYFRKSLSPENWQALKTIKEQEILCKTNGWEIQSQYLKKLRINVNVDDKARKGDLANAIIEVIKTRETVNNINLNWQNIQADELIIMASDIPLFKRVRELYTNKQLTGSSSPDNGFDDLIKLNAELSDINTLSDNLLKFLNEAWDNNIIDINKVKDPENKMWTAYPDLELTKELLEGWISKVNTKYRKLNPALDPRNIQYETWNNTIKEIDKLCREFEKLPDIDISQSVLNTINNLKSTRDNLTKQEWNTDNKEDIERRTSELNVAMNEVLKIVKNEKARAEEINNTSYEEYKNNLKKDNEISQTGSQSINRTWRDKRNLLLDKDEGRKILSEKITTLKNFLLDMETRDELPNNLDSAMREYVVDTNMKWPQQWDRNIVSKAMADYRESIISRGLENIEWDNEGLPVYNQEFDQKWTELKNNYREYTRSTYNIITKMVLMEKLMTYGYNYNETVNNPTLLTPINNTYISENTLDKIHNTIIKNKYYNNVENAFSAVNARLTAIREISQNVNNTDYNTLISYAKTNSSANNSKPELMLAAWKLLNMSPGWPRDVNNLDTEMEIRANISAWVALLDNNERQNELVNILKQAGSDTWCKYVENCADDNAFQTALNSKTIKAFYNRDTTPDIDNIAELSDRSKYNLMLYLLKKQIELTPPSDNEVPEQIINIKTKINQYGNLDKTTNKLIRGLNDLQNDTAGLTDSPDPDNRENTGTIGPDYSNIGPGKINGWEYDENASNADGSEITYNWQATANNKTNTAKTYTLKFKRFAITENNNNVEENFYLATTEMPIGLLIEVITQSSANAWQTLIDSLTLITFLDSNGDETRQAPLSWRWNDSRNEMIISADGNWLEPTTDYQEKMFYPSDMPEIDKPSAMQPAQFISPQLAIYVANLIGCRLPTQSEWVKAYNLLNNTNTIYNLRDQTWAQQRDHISSLLNDQPLMSAYWPDNNTFIPDGLNVKIEKEAEVSPQTQTDNVLWFSKVDQNSRSNGIYHLIGNVAEYLYNTTTTDHDQENNILQNPLPDIKKITAMLKNNKNNLKIIGGSALSAPQIITNQPYPVDLYYAQDGYSDVGFRLAFTAPVDSLAVKFQRLVAAQEYLKP